MTLTPSYFTTDRRHWAHVILKQLKSQGLGIKQLHIVFTALIVSRVLFALHAWGGFLSSDLLDKIIDSILRKAQKFSYATESSRLRICCKTQIISSFRSCSDLVTASIHYYPISKWLILSYAALELASICLSYKLYKQSFVNNSFSRLL